MKRTLLTALSLTVIGLVLIFAFTGHDFIGLALIFAAAVLLVMKLGGKTLRRVVSIVLAVGLLYFCAVEVFIVRDSRPSDTQDIEYIIVLGAAVHGSTPSLSLRERMDAALEFMNIHSGCTAILSGGQGDDENLSEAQAMFDYLTEKGIDAERLIIEDRSESTLENLRNSFELIEAHGGTPGKSTAVVSSEYHLCRAKLIADSLGVCVSGIPAHTTYPSVRLNYFIREAFGLTYQLIRS